MLNDYYEIFKVVHIVSFTAWMAGLWYLPRIYVYHCDAKFGSELHNVFVTMERRLLRYIINPAMLVTLSCGILMAHMYGFAVLGLWFWIKVVCVTSLLIFHGMLAKWRKSFVLGVNSRASSFYRIINEVPTIIFIIIVIMVVIKPFE